MNGETLPKEQACLSDPSDEGLFGSRNAFVKAQALREILEVEVFRLADTQHLVEIVLFLK